jgi:Cu/Zn superoxide dismutase
MFRVGLIGTVIWGIAMLAVVSGGDALAQESVVLQLAPSRDSGVSGTATLRELGSGVEVEVSMRGLPTVGVKHINHFHAGGTCADDRAGNPAPATIPLTTIEAGADGTGSATTTLRDVTLTDLLDEDKERYLAFHSKVEDEPVPPVISCADVTRTSSGAVDGNLPDSGGPLLAALIVGLLLVLAGSPGLLIAKRRWARLAGFGRFG